MRRFVILVSLLLSALTPSFSQAPQTGLYEFGPYDTPGFDTINRGNLDVHLSIPIFSKPGRGGSNFSLALNYDSLVWTPSTVTGGGAWLAAANWGWTTVSNAEYGYVSYNLTTGTCTVDGTEKAILTYNKFIYHDQRNGAHPFPFAYTTPCGGGDIAGSGSYAVSDNSGYTIYHNGTAFTAFTKTGEQYVVQAVAGFNGRPGTVPSSAGVYTDTNGNQISASSSGVFTDTLGKTALTVTGSGTASSPMVYTYTDTTGTSRSVTVNYTAYTVTTAFGLSGTTEYSGTSIPLVTSIVYSDGSQYSFLYESTPGSSTTYTGRIRQITLPTGGTIKYSYTGGSEGIEADGSTSGLTRTTSDGAVSYARTGVSSTASTTNYTDASSNVTQSTFLEDTQGYIYETSRSVYTGAVSGTPLQQLTTCYSQTVDCSTNSVAAPIGYVSTNLMNNGTSVSTDQRHYSGGFLLDDNDSIIDVATGYQTFTGANSIDFARVSTVTTTDEASSRQIAKTSYSYDQGTVDTFSGSPQPVAVSTARGNLTNTLPWLNTTNATFNETTIVNDTTGSPQTSTDSNGKVTLNYESTGSFLTKLTPPTPSSGVSLPVQASYNMDTGLPLLLTDPNGAQVSYKSYNSMLQPTEIDNFDNVRAVIGKTTFDYPSSILHGTYQYQSSSSNGSLQTQVDGYGRASRSAIDNGQSGNGWYQQDVCYDANGRIAFQSYKYQGTGFTQGKVCSGAGDSYTYDAAGRVIKITHGDGSTIGYSFKGHAAEVVDENGVSRISQVDGHGRITKICEITSQSLQGANPGSCGTDISGTGFVTTYAYTTDSSANQITTITQGSQTRVSKTDSLGRTVYVSEPERGITNYSYAYNGTGLVVTRTRPQANQSASGTLTTTTTQLDTIGRVVSVSYNDGLTPNKAFVYDAESGWTATATFLKGRLVSMGSGSGATHTGSLTSYDAMGRPINQWQCGPNTCPNYNQDSHLLSYAYDWTGALTGFLDSGSGRIAYGRSVAGEVNSISNDNYQINGTQTGGSAAPVISNIVNGPNGPISYGLANGLNVEKTYDGLGRLNGQYVCQGPAAVSCSGGTQLYGYSLTSKGARVTSTADTIQNQDFNFSYDDFNRLTSYGGTYTYTYDRYGNRWSQTASSGTSFNFSASYNAATNQINTSGYSYDAAGNMANDGINTYQYDAEGNILSVNGGGTAGQYVYDAMNRRVWVENGSATYEYAYDSAGRRVSSWAETANTANEGRIYWGGQPIGYRGSDGTTYFEHENYLGTERMRTDYTGAVAAKFTSLPWGDDYAATIVKATATQDFLHFAGLEQDTNSSNNVIDDHAQFRSYSFGQGRWLSPDPYDGSYDITNPQSFNRYAYVLNNPLTLTDPTGLHCAVGTGCGGGDCANDPNCDGENGPLPGYGGGGCSGMFCDPWGGPPGTPLDSIAAGEELQWLSSGSIPWYSVQGGELMLLVADPWAYVSNASIFTWEQVPTWADLGTATASSGTYSYFGGVPGGGGGGGGSVASKSFWQKNWDCVSNVGLPVILDDLNPFSLGIGTAADVASQMSEASMEAAAGWSIQRGLTVPLRSSIVRAGVANAEALGVASYALSLAALEAALVHGVIAEHAGCQF